MNTVREATEQLLKLQTGSIPWATVYAVSAAVITGVLIVSAVGFAGSEILHNAAHDVRHGLSFPCH